MLKKLKLVTKMTLAVTYTKYKVRVAVSLTDAIVVNHGDSLSTVLFKIVLKYITYNPKRTF